MNWNKISLYKFQQIQAINLGEMSDMDKVLWSVCIAFNLTEFQLDKMKLPKAGKLINKLTKLFKSTPEEKPLPRIGKYAINYDPAKMTLGQYVSLSSYIGGGTINNAHKMLATITQEGVDIGDQDERAEYFLEQPITRVIGAIKQFNENYASFNQRYSGLFGLSTENAEQMESNPFHKHYGWIFSATMVADHCRVNLDEAFGLSVKEAFNHLAYLKAKAKYEEQQIKSK